MSKEAVAGRLRKYADRLAGMRIDALESGAGWSDMEETMREAADLLDGDARLTVDQRATVDRMLRRADGSG